MLFTAETAWQLQKNLYNNLLVLISMTSDNESWQLQWSNQWLWEASSGSESIKLRNWQTENSTSGWKSFWERSPVGSWFSTSLFRNAPGTVPESVRICGLKKKLSTLDRAPKSGTFSCWIPGTVFQWPCLQSPQKRAWCIPQ